MTQYTNHSRQKGGDVKILYQLLPSLFCLMLTSGIACGQSSPEQFEQQVILKASDLLDADLLKSSLYTVDDQVVNDGLFNNYTVNSVYGTFKASSTMAVKQLLHEIEVIAKMKEVETANTVKESVVQSGKNTIDAVANLVSDPQKALEGAATGISSLFNRATQVVGRRETTHAEDNKLEQVIGKSKSKGKIATTYQVSVYSLNPVLQQELERLAWADYLGGIGVGLAQSVVPGAGGLLLSASGTTRLLNEVINTTPASELWVQNKNKLTAMSIDEETVELYLNNPSFSPALQTVMVEALTSMRGVNNLALFIKISLQAHTDKMARDLTGLATMIAGYHKNVAPLESLAPFGRILYAQTKKGAAVVTVPADRVLWSKNVADSALWLLQPIKGEGKPASLELWVIGDFSERARQEFESLGWGLHANALDELLPEKK